jgi:hypothetical protein
MRRLALISLTLTLVLCAPAAARDPGRWTLTGWSSVSNNYWQGMTSAGAGQLFFTGPLEGLHRTARNLRQTASAGSAIPPSVKAAEGYNHVGDPGFQGGRVLLPLECYTAGGPNGGNTCGTGSIGVADPATLGFEYYVKLDPSEIAKAMWVEAQGELLWTSSGQDLLAYRASDVSAGNAAPGAAPIHSVRRLAGAVPPSGVTGAAIYRGRLLLAGAQGTTYQVWSVDTDTGARRLELELPRVQGEAEGLALVPKLLGGQLHFVVAPLASRPTFGPSVGVLHFAPGRWAGRGLRLTVRATRQSSPRPRVHVRVTKSGRPVEAVVHVAGKRAETNARGRATVTPTLAVPGTFAAMAQAGRQRGRSKFLRLGEAPAAAGPARTTPAR